MPETTLPVGFDQFPPDVLKYAEQHTNGLRFVRLGEDGDTVVILGHPADHLVNDYSRWQESDWGNDPDHYAPTAGELPHTFARLLYSCPDHEQPSVYCGLCNTDSDWWMDWQVTDGQPLDANAGKPGYFPVVVWRVD